MKYYTQYKKQNKIGQESEDSFKEIAKKQGYKVKKATKKENKRLHIDFYITKDGCTSGVDVKTVGKNGFSVEISNNFGYAGSIFGEAKYMGYISRNTIYLVDREKLLEMVLKNIKGEDVYQSDAFYTIEYPYYRLYTRNQKYGWNDEFIYVPSIDMIGLATEIWRF